tara:strand:- start:132 stop:383 length:252 start_codon:yes stop_codon:yes gene_type:complete
MAHKKQGGRVSQQAQRAGRRLGVKVSGGQKVRVGSTLVRQRGTKFHPAENVSLGRDHTLYAAKPGQVVFKKRQGKSLVGIQVN